MFIADYIKQLEKLNCTYASPMKIPLKTSL